MSMDNVFEGSRRRSTSNYNAHDDIGALLAANEADQRAAMPGLHAMRVDDEVEEDSVEDAPALSGDDDDEQQDIESSSDDNDDDSGDDDYDVNAE